MDTVFETKILICADCGEEFVFTIKAQEYFAEKGYTEDPKLCKACFMQHKREKKSHGRQLPAGIDVSAGTTDSTKTSCGAGGFCR